MNSSSIDQTRAMSTARVLITGVTNEPALPNQSTVNVSLYLNLQTIQR